MPYTGISAQCLQFSVYQSRRFSRHALLGTAELGELGLNAGIDSHVPHILELTSSEEVRLFWKRKQENMSTH